MNLGKRYGSSGLGWNPLLSGWASEGEGCLLAVQLPGHHTSYMLESRGLFSPAHHRSRQVTRSGLVLEQRIDSVIPE
ncbi:MAG TPA: hypothetical protein VFG08_03830, partial [Candidatus Polarisedimenticolia bacterium]|nr:hypothetical protein [Candidatus Polarisedimenticolia bacterium]